MRLKAYRSENFQIMLAQYSEQLYFQSFILLFSNVTQLSHLPFLSVCVWIFWSGVLSFVILFCLHICDVYSDDTWIDRTLTGYFAFTYISEIAACEIGHLQLLCPDIFFLLWVLYSFVFLSCNIVSIYIMATGRYGISICKIRLT